MNRKKPLINTKWMPNEIVQAFQNKSNNKSNGARNNRVYFTCHPDDMENQFIKNKIMNDILQIDDTTIYYTENMNAFYGRSLGRTDLKQMDLFVIPVTENFLYDDCRARDIDVPFAISNRIPILPIVFKTETYNEKNEIKNREKYERIFGRMQYLQVAKKEKTEVPYKVKLENFLQDVLVDHKLREEILNAFDAYIFLSYRKKDREYANQVMKTIHQNPLFSGTAIWYDEYLTPGENFEKEILKAMSNSNMIILLVTNSLLEKSNYVMTIEYPVARKMKKVILPIEAQKADRKLLKKYYKRFPNCVSIEEQDKIYNEIANVIGNTIIKKEYDEKKNYLIGLAYLNGICMEKNPERAVEFIEKAAEAGLQEATEKIIRIYEHGIGLQKDYNKVIYWMKKDAERTERQYGSDSVQFSCKQAELARGYLLAEQEEVSLELYKKAYAIQKETYGEYSSQTVAFIKKNISSVIQIGIRKGEVLIFWRELYCDVLKLNGFNSDLIDAFLDLGYAYSNTGYYTKAKETYDYLEHLYTENNVSQRMFNSLLGFVANNYYHAGEYSIAIEVLEHQLKTYDNYLGEYWKQIILSNMAANYIQLGNYLKATELYKEAYEIEKKEKGEQNTNTNSAWNSYQKGINTLKMEYGIPTDKNERFYRSEESDTNPIEKKQLDENVVRFLVENGVSEEEILPVWKKQREGKKEEKKEEKKGIFYYREEVQENKEIREGIYSFTFKDQNGKEKKIYGYYDEEKSEEFFWLTNKFRLENSLSELEYNYACQDICNLRAQELIIEFSNKRPDGTMGNSAYPNANSELVGMSYRKNSENDFFTTWKENRPYSRILLSESKSMCVGKFVCTDEEGKFKKETYVLTIFTNR